MARGLKRTIYKCVTSVSGIPLKPYVMQRHTYLKHGQNNDRIHNLVQLPLAGAIDELLQPPHGLVLIVGVGDLLGPAKRVQHARCPQPTNVNTGCLGQVRAERARLPEPNETESIIKIGRICAAPKVERYCLKVRASTPVM